MPGDPSGARVSGQAPGVATDLDDLLPDIAAGDASAFARWLAGTEGRLRDSLRSFAAWVDTEAVVQEALIRAFTVAPRVRRDGKPDVLLRLTIRIARNLAVSELRRNRVTGIEVDPEPPAPEPPSLPDPRVRQAIDDCRRQLPDRPGIALTGRIENDGQEPDAVLAARLGMRINTFLKNLSRARSFMAECLRRRGIDIALEMS
jgi:DNA-directed RNA polymerase specialized sigma24 family protein